MTEAEAKLARALWDVGAIQDRHKSPGGQGFRLKLHESNPQAPLSPIYLNLRVRWGKSKTPGILTVPVACQIVREMVARTDQCGIRLDFFHVAGVPHAGDPFALEFVNTVYPPAHLLKLGKEDGPGGRRVTRLMQGDQRRAETVLLIDDLITKADSKLEAIRVLESAGLQVRDVLVIVDREQGGRQELKRAGYRLHAIFTLRQLLDFYHATGLMEETIHAEIVAYLQANG